MNSPEPHPITFRLDIAYDGTDFSGWQVQNSGISIQGTIEKAIEVLTHEAVRIVGSGRTDAGVHALNQVAHFHLATDTIYKDPSLLKRALNGLLPDTIRIINVAIVPKTFHAQRSASSKEYHYHLCFDDVVLPFVRPYVWHCRKRVNIDVLIEAAKLFIGEHDFVAYSNAPGRGCQRKTTVRTLYRLDVIRTQTGVRLEFEGNGFLYKMVRNITGMIIGVASGRRSIEEISTVFQSKDRRIAEPAAPARGLFLVRVNYGKVVV